MVHCGVEHSTGIVSKKTDYATIAVPILEHHACMHLVTWNCMTLCLKSTDTCMYISSPNLSLKLTTLFNLGLMQV